MTNSISDFKEADVLLITGSNTTETHPVIGMLLRNRARFNGAKIIVVDPRRIDLVEEADLFLQPKPGDDIAWLNGLAHIIIKENLYHQSFIAEHTEGFEAVKEKVSQYTPEHVEKITGIPKDQLIRAARMYATAKNAAILYCMGITQHSKGTDGVKAISNLALLCGQLGKSGSGVNPLRGQNNVQGACDMGCLPTVYPGYQGVALKELRNKFENHWGVSLPEKPGLTVVEMSEAADEGKMKAVYIMGENPMVTDPDLSHLRKAYEKLELLVVQDIFLTESAQVAHVVFPSLSFLEKDGTFVNTERRVQRVRKAINGPEGARTDWEIISDLSSRFGYPMSYRNSQEIFEELRKVTPQYAGITYERIDSRGIQWPCPDITHPGTPFLHKGKIARGKGLFVPVDFMPPPEVPDRDYPFILSTGRDYYHYHAGSMTRKVRLLNEMCPESLLEINPSDADHLGINDGDQVKVVGRRGDFVSKVKVTDKVARGVTFAKFHFAETPVNILTNTVLDPESKITDLKYSTVRLEKYVR
jgi:formate dehydrogenase major subunit/formate dehydrogenase alpha subunit